MEVNTTSTVDPVNMYNYLNNFALNPIIFIIILLVIISYFVFFNSLGNNKNENQLFNINGSDNNNNSWQRGFGILVIIIIIIILLINAFQYFFSINITAYLKNLFTNQPEVDVIVDQNTGNEQVNNTSIPEITFRKQVFNIPGNYYTYENAKALCSAYGADLANYKQIEDAYKNGGEWCNYGWSENQMALFPTQQASFDNLQQIKGHEHDCGRPGINGGYIANPQVKFGVNCYGNKPKINQEEDDLMKTSSPYPKTIQDIEFQKKIDYWKNHIDEILVSPFNYNIWGEA
jgi:hypothetical protein